LYLVQQEGFWEYYHTFTGKGLGTKNFSWTSALILDLICGEKSSDSTSDKIRGTILDILARHKYLHSTGHFKDCLNH